MLWELRCYLDSRGGNPVEEFIQILPGGDQALIRARIDFLGEVGNRSREPPLQKSGRRLIRAPS